MTHKGPQHILQDLDAAVQTMRRGGIILYPTDTVWGLGCDATCHQAIRRIFQLKQRAESKSMISLVAGPEMLGNFSTGLSHSQISFADNPAQPTTIIVPSPLGIDPLLIAPDGSAAFRITHEHYSNSLCRMLGRPVVSTSANISGQPTPAVFSEIAPEIIEGADHVAMYRRLDNRRAKPSRIVKPEPDGSLTVIRE